MYYNMHFTEDEMVGSVAVFDTRTDMWVTGVWPWRFAERILRMWERRGRDMSCFELRRRELDIPDNTALLILSSDDIIVAFFHWDNRQYARAFTDESYRFVKYTPPGGLDVKGVYEQFGQSTWDGIGRIVSLDKWL